MFGLIFAGIILIVVALLLVLDIAICGICGFSAVRKAQKTMSEDFNRHAGQVANFKIAYGQDNRHMEKLFDARALDAKLVVCSAVLFALGVGCLALHFILKFA